MLEGKLTRLRKLEKTDLPLAHRWVNDRDVVGWARFSPEHMTSLTELEKEFEKELVGEDTERITYMIEERSTGRPIGWCVLRTWDRKHVGANVGISIGEKDLWGKGFGTDAMRVLLAMAFDHMRWHRAELWTLAENERAIKSFEKCGFRREGVAHEAAYYDGRYHDVVYMGLLKQEWDAKKAG